LLLTTVVAGLLGLALTVSVGASLFGLIVALAAANCWGVFEHLRSAARRKFVFGAAWVGFGVSLMLPAVRMGCGASPIYGWQAAYSTLCAQPEIFMETVSAESLKQAVNRSIGFYCYAQMNSANLLLILVPIVMLRWPSVYGHRLALFQYWAVTGVPLFGHNNDRTENLLIGFYIWVFTHALLVTVLPFGARAKGNSQQSGIGSADRWRGVAWISGMGLVQFVMLSIFGD
jgi:hypothetical protein